MKSTPSPRRQALPELRSILVPTDFSRCSARALDYAIPLAQKVGGRITPLHVIEWPLVPAELGNLVSDEAKAQAEGSAVLDDIAARRIPADVRGRAVIRNGTPHREIVAAARSLRADLVVIATQGRTGLKRLLLGSTAERVVRHAGCPVLTVPPRAQGTARATLPIKRILVPVDFSKSSVAAVKRAIQLARLTSARVALVHVVPMMPEQPTRFRVMMRQYVAEIAAEARKRLEKLAASAAEDFEVQAFVRHGTPHREILAAAREWRSDLIVLPGRSRVGKKYVFLGSTAEPVVRQAPCPVLTLPGK